MFINYIDFRTIRMFSFLIADYQQSLLSNPIVQLVLLFDKLVQAFAGSLFIHGAATMFTIMVRFRNQTVTF